ncbi:tRNA-2-methylthio-N(6)-dimethylallyladenosine synthase [Metallosphaera sp. J1]|uniref:tRNA (N(6)-L-threonylcarbamoyladenosine(37)-C(2))- methylthiotransferase n=1 Tax=Metallosphaera javensis (ex Hofmann et al. 2022) TaxID=99938 RepID=UPI001EDF72C1|nr:tRNA (N(6)-L-threonylcarbamoyladenosine(37)-C(2))-methylthiotransferase [Metallosphaera javensis (ex Hofmann et al. 2022)]MCG3108422.1 tRNA-2-methylthio-N(6)-dimethylallyladenosine synthase [Metallosphaera javensis (ex Hofmann et al. 2022)]
MRIYFETYGCALNKGDTYSMMTLLKNRKHEIVNSEEEADVLVINTCAVRMETEEKMKKRISELSRAGKKLVVAGCLAGAEPGLVTSLAPQSSLIGPQSIGDIVKAVESKERIVSLYGEAPSVLPGLFEGLISVIPIADGCAGSCNFCITKLARRELRSYPPRMIVEAVRKAVERGAKEVELTGQDTAAYGLDLGGEMGLAELVKEVSSLEGDFMVRIGMMTPELAMRQLERLLDAWDNSKVYKFFHLPVQSGNDHVLRVMNRKYTVDEYREIVKEIRKRFPLVNITTDIIVGHPGEDEAAFEDTLRLMKELRFERIHIAMYSLRPNTRSAMMIQVPGAVKKERLKRAVSLYEELSREIHREYVGRRMKVIALENGKGDTQIGRTLNYIPVILRGAELGKWYEVEITDSSFFDLRGTIV